MKTYIIITVLKNFEFPLREAVRKQIWWEAKAKFREGYNVKIMVIGTNTDVVTKEGITINFITFRKFIFSKFVADYISVVNGSITYKILPVLFSKGTKIITLTDGYVLGNNKKFVSKLILFFYRLFFKRICVYSQYQEDIIKGQKVEVVKPYLPDIEINKEIKRSAIPRLLYMGHLSFFKGVDNILDAFEMLINTGIKFELVI
nr:hypothetical protein [Bacteroidales bacterium]